MAWECVRCHGKIYADRKNQASHSYVMEWRYVKYKGELFCEFKHVSQAAKGWLVTHIQCDRPMQENWMKDMRDRLGVPKDAYHPLLDE